MPCSFPSSFITGCVIHRSCFNVKCWRKEDGKERIYNGERQGLVKNTQEMSVMSVCDFMGLYFWLACNLFVKVQAYVMQICVINHLLSFIDVMAY
jgi:hypothetical protein